MPKINIDTDEWYPVYLFKAATGDRWERCVREISDDKVKEWQAAFDKFAQVQDEIEKAMKP